MVKSKATYSNNQGIKGLCHGSFAVFWQKLHTDKEMLLNDPYLCQNIPLNVGESEQSFFFLEGKVIHSTFLVMA